MTALASKLGLLRPLARSRLVGALVEKLPGFRSAALEDPRFLQIQRCSDAWEESVRKSKEEIKSLYKEDIKKI